MAMIDLYYPLLESMLQSCEAALSPAPGRAFVAPGQQVAWDDCCEGQVWTRLASVQPHEYPARGLISKGGCGPLYWKATIEVGVVRCVSTLDDDGSPPSATDISDDAMQALADMTALEQALRCVVGPSVAGLRFLRYDPAGPQGGCAGGAWQVEVVVDSCGCGDT